MNDRVIVTARLKLRSMAEADLDTLFTITSDEAVMAFVGDGKPLSRASTAEWIANASRSLPETGLGSRAVVHSESSALIGWAGLVWRPDDAVVELIYGLARPFWGRGYATEAAAALIAASEVRSIDATIDPANAASRRILEKLGFAEAGTELEEDGLPSVRFRRIRRP